MPETKNYIIKVRDRNGNDHWANLDGTSIDHIYGQVKAQGGGYIVLGVFDDLKSARSSYTGEDIPDFTERSEGGFYNLPKGGDPPSDKTTGTAAVLDKGSAAAIREAEERFRYGSFLNAAGPAASGQFGSTVRDQFTPLDAASKLAGIVSGLPGMDKAITPDDPQTAHGFFSGGLGKANEIAAVALRGLFEGRTTDSPLAPGRVEEFLNPDVGTERGETDMNTMRRLGRAAGTHQMGSFIGGNLLPDSNRVYDRLQQLLASGGFGTQDGSTNPTAADFIRQQFGLNF